jgi:hypothetical protein
MTTARPQGRAVFRWCTDGLLTERCQQPLRTMASCSNERTAMPYNAIHWFEIPVADLDRAQRFYETLLAKAMRREQMGPQTLAVFAYEDGIGGALLKSDTAPAPGIDGTLAYLNAGPSLDAVLSRAGELGATVLLPKTELPRNIGFIAQIVDSEGNRIGLHSQAA